MSLDVISYAAAKRAQAKADAAVPAALPAITLPAGLGWDTSVAPLPVITKILRSVGRERPVAVLGETPEQYFTRVSGSNVLTDPEVTYYVSTSGNDTTGTGASGAPFRSVAKAISTANAAAKKAKIIVAPNYQNSVGYSRKLNAWWGSVSPQYDIALLANGGRVCLHGGDLPSELSPQAVGSDATYPNCAKFTVSTVNRVCDTRQRDQWGLYKDLLQVSTAAICNAVPDSWALVSGTLYVHRADHVAIDAINTRIFRPDTPPILISNPVNVFVGGIGAGAGFDFEGGSGSGAFAVAVGSSGSPMTSTKTLLIAESTFRYGGGATNTGGRGLGVESWRGPVVAWNCDASGNNTDGFNIHNAFGAAHQYFINVNSSGFNNGRTGQVSCNGFTLHEDCKGIDICGIYDTNHGGTLRNINTTKSLFVETVVLNDQGDQVLTGDSGGMLPTGVQMDNNAEAWMLGGRVEMPSGGYSYRAGDTAKIHLREVRPTVQTAAAGTGTIDTW